MDRVYNAIKRAELIGALLRKGCMSLGIRDKHVLVMAEIGSGNKRDDEGWICGMPSAAALSASTGFHRSTVAITLKNLVDRGYVEPVRDGQLNIHPMYFPVYRLTEDGRRQLPHVRGVIASVEAAVFGAHLDQSARGNAIRFDASQTRAGRSPLVAGK